MFCLNQGGYKMKTEGKKMYTYFKGHRTLEKAEFAIIEFANSEQEARIQAQSHIRECSDSYDLYVVFDDTVIRAIKNASPCLLYTSPSPRD